MEIGIIGAGTMGCVLGYRLSQAGYRVRLIESGSNPGGLSTWFDFGAFVWDKYYHVILRSDEHLLNLIQELDLNERLHWSETKTGFLWKGQHVSMSNHWEFLSFPPLNLFQKARLAAGILYSHWFVHPKSLHNLTARDWLLKIFGKRVYEIIWEPLLESKFGVLRDEIPATIIWSTLTRYYSTREKSGGQEKLGHLKGGALKVLYDALTNRIESRGGSIVYNTTLEKIEHVQNKSVNLHCSKGTYSFDRVISTIPTPVLQNLAPELSELYPQHSPPKFLGIIRLALVLNRSLSPFYVTNLIDRGMPFTGIIEVSRLGSLQEFGNHHFVMVPRYDIPSSPWFQKSDEEIKRLFLDQMRAYWPDIDKHILATFVHREKIVQALWIDTPPPTEKARRTKDHRIWNVNNELAGYSTLNNNSVVEVANRVAKEIAEDIRNYG